MEEALADAGRKDRTCGGRSLHRNSHIHVGVRLAVHEVAVLLGRQFDWVKVTEEVRA